MTSLFDHVYHIYRKTMHSLSTIKSEYKTNHIINFNDSISKFYQQCCQFHERILIVFYLLVYREPGLLDFLRNLFFLNLKYGLVWAVYAITLNFLMEFDFNDCSMSMGFGEIRFLK